MATFKAVVRRQCQRQDGSNVVSIRVTHNRESVFLKTHYYATKNDLSKDGTRIKSRQLHEATDAIIARFRRVCDTFGTQLDTMSVKELASKLTQPEKVSWHLDFVAYTREYADKIEAQGKLATASMYRTAINNFCTFLGRDRCDIGEISASLLNRWIEWIPLQPSAKKRGGRAQSLYLTQVKAMYNRARKEFNDDDLGIVRIPGDPFKRVECPKPPTPEKRAITVAQLCKIIDMPYEETPLPNSRRNLAKDMFILSFCLVGMNAADLYSCLPIDDGRITYQRTKTRSRRSDHALISVKVEPEAALIISKYADNKRLLRLYKMYATTNTLNQALNKGLKQIGEEIGVPGLQFYAARHTWATIAANEAGIDKWTVHECLNHADLSMRVTDYYIKRDWSHIDRANRRVLDYVTKRLKEMEDSKEERKLNQNP